jgi:hypothetical protein
MKVRHTIVVAVVALLVVASCPRESILEEMRQVVPLQEGARLVEAKEIPGEGEGIMQYDIEAAQSSEDDIIEFYRSRMTESGWKFEDIERWAGNGSVFSMTCEDQGTLTVQTVTKQTEKTGKIRVVLNLKRE